MYERLHVEVEEGEEEYLPFEAEEAGEEDERLGVEVEKKDKMQ